MRWTFVRLLGHFQTDEDIVTHLCDPGDPRLLIGSVRSQAQGGNVLGHDPELCVSIAFAGCAYEVFLSGSRKVGLGASIDTS